MFRVQRVVYLIEMCRGRLSVRAAAEAEIKAWNDEHPEAGIPAVAKMSIEDVRSLFDDTTLARAQRIARLPPARFTAIFGQVRRSRHYPLGWRLRRIGAAIPGSAEGCGRCVAIQEACSPGCARRLVAEALGNESLTILDAAARHAEPVEQVRAAVRARIGQRSRRSKRAGAP